MKITITDNSVNIIDNSSNETVHPKNSLRYGVSKLKDNITFNGVNNFIIASSISNITVDGVQLTKDNINELLSPLFFFEIEIEDVIGLPEALEAEKERATNEEQRIEKKFDDFTTLENPNGIIDTWQELENFISGISDSDQLLTILLDQKQKLRSEFTDLLSNSVVSFNNFVTSSYNSLLSDADITDANKTSLTTAYNVLKTKSDALLTAINDAISGGKTTDAQLTAVKEKYGEYSTQLGSYKTIEETTRQNIGKNRIASTKIGGVNTISTLAKNWQQGMYKYDNGAYSYTLTAICLIDLVEVIPNGTYAISEDENYSFGLRAYDENKVFLHSLVPPLANTILGRKARTLTIPEDVYFISLSLFNNDLNMNLPISDLSKIKVKFEKGNFPTDYSPSPIDIEDKIKTLEDRITALGG